MKLKRRRVLEVPPKIRAFINDVISVPLEDIEQPLRGFNWEFDKGDFHHWVDLFNHFDSFFEKHVKTRKDLQLEDDFTGEDPPFPREAVFQILRVVRIVLENCTNKHFYSSYEQHLSSLLACTDADIVEASLQTFAAFLKKTIGKCSIRDPTLNSRLFAFSQGWGSKEEGLGLIACATENGCDSVAHQLGSTLHFEFYESSGSLDETGGKEDRKEGLQVIHLPDIGSCHESDLDILNRLVMEYKVPPRLRFSLLTRLRFARSFRSLASRQQYICIRLYAFVVLVQASNDADDLTAFFSNEPEFVNELVTLLSYEDLVPEKIRILAILSLVALCQDRSRQPTVLAVVTSGGHQGILPSLMQKAVDSITIGSSKWSVVFAEALLSLVTVLVSSSSGCSALREAGFIPTLLPLLKDINPQHLHLVSTAVHILEAFMDYSNPAATLFRDLGGLGDTIARLKIEVSYVEKGKKNEDEHGSNINGKTVVDNSSEVEVRPLYSESLVSYHRRLLMKALLRAISLGTYAPGSTARIYGSEESLLPECLCIIFRRAKDFGGGVFSLAATVMSDLIHKDPTYFSVLDAADLPCAFLDAIMGGVLCSAEAISCIPQCLDALCLNNNGLQAVKDRNALRCFVKIFTSRVYLRALSGDTPGSLSTGLDELMRHASSLRGPGVDMLIEILHAISKIGSGSESTLLSVESVTSPSPIPMETDVGERALISSSDGLPSKVENSDQIVEASTEGSLTNVEPFLVECISNVARLLENVLQNADTCRIFIEKKGIEAVLQLFTLPLLPPGGLSGQSISVAFKSFSPQHSAALARAVCAFLKEHLKLTNELLLSVAGTQLVDVEVTRQSKVLRCLSSLEGLLSFSNFFLKGTTTMVSELGSADADALKDLGKIFKEILWQLSLMNDSKMEEKQDCEQEGVSADALTTNISGRENDDLVSFIRYVNPVSIRSSAYSRWWAGESDFLSVIHHGEGVSRHGRRHHGNEVLSRARGGRNSRHPDGSHIDSEGSTNASETTSHMQESKRKSPDVLISEVLNKLAAAMRSFHATLVKGFSAPSRRRADPGSLSSAAKNLATALAKTFHESLTYSGYPSSSALEMSLSVKCRYLGKVVDDMAALTFDSRRRFCNTALINNFYVHGTFKELLTTFEATSQLLWTLPFSIPGPSAVQENVVEGNKLSHNSWLLDTLQSYCRMLEYFVNSSLLLSPASSSQMLVQPVASGLSIGLFAVPRDPEVFVRMLQSQVLDVILPIWNHPMFARCNPSFITSVVSIVTHVYCGVGDIKKGRNGVTANAGHRFMAPPPDESAIATIVEMGFSRTRAEEALRRVETNSVEMAMEWLFSHAEEPLPEDDELARALALSLGNTSDVSKEDNGDVMRDVQAEEMGAELPPVDDILSASMKLFESSDSVAFPLTDLLVTLCNRNKCEYRPRVVSYLIQSLKLCPMDFSKETGALCAISHILALLLSEDSSTRGIAAENGLIQIVLDILANFKLCNDSRGDILIPKCITTLLLILDNLLQSKQKVSAENPVRSQSGSVGDGFGGDAPLSLSTSSKECKPACDGQDKETTDAFEKMMGKSTGYLSTDESQRLLVIICDFIKQHVPATVMQAILQLCARLTKSHALAMQFLESGGLGALLSLPRSCFFPGYDNIASAIIRHLLEDPQTLQTAMEMEIRQTLTSISSRHGPRVSTRTFLTSMAPVISRDPAVFMRATSAVCQLESSGARTYVVLLKEKDKEKKEEKEDRVKAAGVENGIGSSSNEGIRMPETYSKVHDGSGKLSKGHKRVPHSLAQVIDQLLEIIMSYPLPRKHEHCLGSEVSMEIDPPATKEKGKSKIDDVKLEGDLSSERSAGLAKVTFVLKLMSEILLMYVHVVGVVLRRDSEICQLRGSSQVDGPLHGGLLHHVLHELLPLSSDKTSGSMDEWKDKLSEKASWFLVVLCGRSSEGRRRVIAELVKALSAYSNLESNSTKNVLLPNRKLLAFADLVNSILSKNSSSSTLPGPGCSPDVAKTMIDCGMVQSLTGILQVLDLDHPDATKVVNLILKALENLTRAANASDQLFKSEGVNKKKASSTAERAEDPAVVLSNGEPVENNQAADLQQQEAGVVQVEELPRENSTNSRDEAENQNQPMEQDMRIEVEVTVHAHPSSDHGVEFIRGEMEDGHNTDDVGMTFHVEHRTVDEMGDEDDEDMGDDGDDDEEDDDEDEDEDEDIAEEGGARMSLADTDVEDRDDNGLGDDYNDDIMDEEEDDFHENRVIEVRWREGLDGLDHLQVLGRPGASSGLVDVAGEPFGRLNVDDIFGLRRSSGLDRRRQSGSRPFLERSGLDHVNAFQHPLLVRSSLSGDTNVSVWPSSGGTRDVGSVSVGNIDVAHFYMFDTPVLPSEHAATNFFGDRYMGTAPTSLFDLGVDPLPFVGRRGPGDGRWTDDGQPQAGGQAAALAQAIEEQFVSQLRSLAPPESLPVKSSENSELQGKQTPELPPLNPEVHCPASGDVSANEQGGGLHQVGIPSFNHESSAAAEDASLAPLSHGALNSDIAASEPKENLPAQELNLMHPDLPLPSATESVQIMARDSDSDVLSDVVPDLPPTSVQAVPAVQVEVGTEPNDLVFPFGGSNEPASVESNSSTYALLDSGLEVGECSHGQAVSLCVSVDVEMDGVDNADNQAAGFASSNGADEPSSRQNVEAATLDGNQVEQGNTNNDTSSTNTIDPTFLEALPEDLRAEVLASTQAQSVPSSAYVPPPTEDIDPEFLAALPPDIQAEVLAQQRVQRALQSQQAEGRAVDMDNASIIATFPADLREEVLLTSSDAVLSGLPSPLLAEAQMLRDRAINHYQARGIFGGSHRLGGRRSSIVIDRHGAMDRGVGVTIGRRAVSAIANSLKVKEVEGAPLLDVSALRALVCLLRVAQPLGKGLLQRLLLNLCAHSVTRAALVCLLIDMIKPEAHDVAGTSSTITSQRLYGCQWNVVYGRPQLSDGLPPLVSRRILEILTYLAMNHLAVANILLYLDQPLKRELLSHCQVDSRKEKGKGKLSEGSTFTGLSEASQKGEIPLILFLKLLRQQLFLRSNAHLEQVMSLLHVVVNNAASKIDSELPCKQATTPSSQVLTNEASDAQKDASTSEQDINHEPSNKSEAEVSTSAAKQAVNPRGILLQLPERELRNLCNLLAHEGLSDKVYSLAAEVLKKLASVAAPHRKFFISELASLAHGLSSSAVNELLTLQSTHMLGLSAGSMAGAAILRVLQALSTLTLVNSNGKNSEENEAEQDDQITLLELNQALQQLWHELSVCISKTESQLGQSSSLSPLSSADAGNHVGGASALSPPLPPGTQRLLPFIEAFFVLCEKLQSNSTIIQQDVNNVTAREVKESAGSSVAPSKCGGATQKRHDGTITFARFADKHRRLLNAFIRQNPGLLEKSLSLILKAPKLIDFDNKRAYFRSRIRQQHEQHPSAPLRISVRRAYVLEDSYNQLRLRPSQDLKGRLTVQFQGEEGIDAGGLTREWYQLLSRVIFDKGALLFTTVGNNATFQPNPNSVYQPEHLSYFKFVGRVVAKALFDGQLLDVYFTRSFYKHILGVKVTYHDIEAVDPDYYKNLKWMLENDVSDIPDLTFSIDADEEKHILYEKTEVTDHELIPGGRNIRVTEETKHEYVDLVAEHHLNTAIRPQINSFLEGFNELVPRDLISIFNDKELELLISGLPEIEFDDLKANTEYTGYTAASSVIQWFWEVVKTFSKEDMARLLQFVTGTSKVPLEGFKALQGISGPQRFQIHKAYGAPERLPSAHTCFNQLDLPEYSSKEQLQDRLLLAIHEASEGFGFG